MDDKLFRKLIITIIILIISILVYLIISKILKKVFKLQLKRKNERKAKTAYSLFNNVIRCLIIIVSIVTILGVYGVSTSGLVASLSVVGVVFGLAFQDILKDLLSGLSIILEDQYAIGDTVTIDEFKGEVISLGLRTTKIKSYTGDLKVISNRNITEVINHSLEPSLAIVTIGVSYEDDLNKVEEVLKKLCSRLNNEIKQLVGKIEVLGIESLSSSSIDYKITAKVKPTTQYEVERILKKEIKLEFDKNNISIPYNQVVIHNAGV